jgi:hypothetical protein
MNMSGRKKSKKGPKNKENPNLLDMIPVRNCKWTRQKDDKTRVRILKPRFKSQLGARFGKKLSVKESINVNLDDYGTAVWRIIDGKQTVREIADILKTQFGDEVEPLYPRLGEFIRILESNDFITFEQTSSIEKKKKKNL